MQTMNCVISIVGAASPEMESSLENVEVSFEMAAKTILEWEESTSKKWMMMFERGDEEISRYMQAVSEIQSWIEAKTEAEDQSKGRCVMEQAMALLKYEFETVLTIQIQRSRAWIGEQFEGIFGSQSHSFTGSTADFSSISTGTIFGFDEELDYGALLSEQKICYLRTIAQKMNSTGFLYECVDVYIRVSRSQLDLQFRRFDIRKLRTRDVKKMNWDMLEKEMTGWIRVAKVCFRIVFANQKKLCDQIFAGLGTLSHEAYFIAAVEDHASQLLEVVAALSTCRLSTERLFKILDLHEALSGLLQVVEDLFGSNSVLVEAVESTIGRLSEMVRGILSNLPKTVLHEPSVVPVAGGSVHPLAMYVMNYLVLASDHEETLNALITSKPSFSDYPYLQETESLQHDGRTPFALNLIWIIAVLQFNLEGKSKHYKDASLIHLFMMNNLHYMVEKIKNSPKLVQLLGEVYLEELSVKVGQAAVSYQRSSWGSVLDCLRDEGVKVSGAFSWGVSKSVLRERFKSFNALFEGVHRTQATWLIPDRQLREDLRLSISLKLIPAYRSFLGRFRSHVDCGRNPAGRYIKHTAEDLEAAVLDLFEGISISQR